MVKLIAFWVSLVVVQVGFVSGESKGAENGYALFQEAWRLHAVMELEQEEKETQELNRLKVELGEVPRDIDKFDAYWRAIDARRRPSLRDELFELLAEGGEPSAELLSYLNRYQKVFELVAEAMADDAWQALEGDLVELKMEGVFHVPGWYGMSRVAGVEGLRMLNDGGVIESFNLMGLFNRFGMRTSRLGHLTDSSGYLMIRLNQYGVLATILDQVPQEEMETVFESMKAQYGEILTISDCFRGEHLNAIGIVDDFFDEIEGKIDEEKFRGGVIEAMEDAGADGVDLARVRSGEALSVDQWKEQLLDDLKSFQSYSLNGINNKSTFELREFGKEFNDRVEEMSNGMKLESAMDLELFIEKHLDGGKFSFSKAEVFHAQIGRAISNQFIPIITPTVVFIAKEYRTYVAFERLVLIRMAARIYRHRYGVETRGFEALVGEGLLEEGMLVDPMSGEAFEVRGGERFEAYSVGRDMLDDGGVSTGSGRFHWREKGDLILVPFGE